MTLEDDFDEGVDSETGAKPVGPLRALRNHCLWCCHGSAHEVKLCTAEPCPLWAFRLGHRPAAEEKAAVADLKLYPLERSSTGAEFHDKGGTTLKAIRRRCIDCSGGSQVTANDCTASDCDLHKFRRERTPTSRSARSGGSGLRSPWLPRAGKWRRTVISPQHAFLAAKC